MKKPKKDTIEAAEALYARLRTYRAVATELNMPSSDAPSIRLVVKGLPISTTFEKKIRDRLGLYPIVDKRMRVSVPREYKEKFEELSISLGRDISAKELIDIGMRAIVSIDPEYIKWKLCTSDNRSPSYIKNLYPKCFCSNCILGTGELSKIMMDIIEGSEDE